VNPLHPAPDIQGRTLFLPRVQQDQEPLHLQQLEPLASILD